MQNCVCVVIVVIVTVVTVIAISYSYSCYRHIHTYTRVLAESGKEKVVFIFYGPEDLKYRITDEIKNSNFLRILPIFVHTNHLKSKHIDKFQVLGILWNLYI